MVVVSEHQSSEMNSSTDPSQAKSPNGGGGRLWKVQFSELQRSRDLDLESDHTAYRHASLINLYVHTKFHWNQTNFLWTDGWTDGWTYGCTDVLTDGWTFPPLMLLGRLRGVDLKWIIKANNLSFLKLLSCTIYISKFRFWMRLEKFQRKHKNAVINWVTNCKETLLYVTATIVQVVPEWTATATWQN